MPKGSSGIFDSGRYRDATEHEVAEILRLRRSIKKADHDGDADAKERAYAAMRRLLATMEIKR